MHKYGIRIPKSVKEASGFDEENKNNLRQKVIDEETEKVKAAVAESTTSPDDLVEYQEIDLHIIFDIKLGGKFRRKDRLVAVGRKKRPRVQLHTV